jgi:hypothetical protein
MLLAAAVLVIGCGGRVSTVTFSPDNEGLAKGLAAAIGKKDMKAVELAVKAAERRADGKMLNDEREAIKWCYEQCKAGEWEKAQKYIDACLANK